MSGLARSSPRCAAALKEPGTPGDVIRSRWKETPAAWDASTVIAAAARGRQLRRRLLMGADGVMLCALVRADLDRKIYPY